ncbi:hypothetical protein RFI_27233, partial [Reticulomyxa filosa]
QQQQQQQQQQRHQSRQTQQQQQQQQPQQELQDRQKRRRQQQRQQRDQKIKNRENEKVRPVETDQQKYQFSWDKLNRYVLFHTNYFFCSFRSVFHVLHSQKKKKKKFVSTLSVHTQREAQEVFDEILQVSKYEYFEVHYFYALHLHYACQRLEEAMMQYIFAIICESNWSIAYYYLGCVLYQLRLYTASIFFLNKARRMNSTIPIIQSGFHAICQRLTEYLQQVLQYLYN